MIAIPFTVLALAGWSVAQSTVSLFIPGADNQSLVGSIAGSSGPATTYVIECAPGSDPSSCGFPVPITVVGGASTLHLSLGAPGFTLDAGCAISGSTSAVCVESATGLSANFPGVTTTTLATSEIQYFPVVITAGAGVSAQQSATVTSFATASSTSGSSSTMTTSMTAAPGGSSSTPTSMATSTSSKPSSSSSGTSSSTSSASSSASATAANQTKNAGAMQAVGGSANGAMGAIAVLLAIAVATL